MKNFLASKPNHDRMGARPTHMHLSRTAFVLLTAALFASGIRAQDSVTTMGEEIPGTRSFYFGQSVEHPEALSGIWEALDGQGGAVGIHMNLLTTLSDHASELTQQSWLHLNLGVFHRKGSEMLFGEDGYFSDDPRAVRSSLRTITFSFSSSRPETTCLPSILISFAR